MSVATVTKHGKEYALVPMASYRRLMADAQAPLPGYPSVGADGTSNALEFARASIARRLNSDRRAAGLTLERLADLSGVRQETISRIESGKHTATVRTIDKLAKAIEKAASRRHGRS